MMRRHLTVSKCISDIWSPSHLLSRRLPFNSGVSPAFTSICTFRGVSYEASTTHLYNNAFYSPRRVYPYNPTRTSHWNKIASYHEGRVETLQGYDLTHPECNVPSHIAARVGANIHLQPNHPLNIIKTLIETYWQQQHLNAGMFQTFDKISPIVTTFENFDSLLIPKDHASRTKSDTYFIRDDTMLRTHTSAHQTFLLKAGLDRFLVTGDVYRRDEIDSSHYPIFHQMEGVKVFTKEELGHASNEEERVALVVTDLKQGLEGMVKSMFGDVQVRWVDTYFPFTLPSFELEIFFNGAWLEVLGCGVVHKDILASVGRGEQLGWAFGLGLERLAMVLFSIPDIRLFWSMDDRFKSQFKDGKIVKFQSFSKYPPCLKDLSFWIPESFHPNDLNEIVRSIAGDLVEKVELIDQFIHPKTKRTSNCFRIYYRSMERSLTNDEIDSLQERVRFEVVAKLNVEIR